MFGSKSSCKWIWNLCQKECFLCWHKITSCSSIIDKHTCGNASVVGLIKYQFSYLHSNHINRPTCTRSSCMTVNYIHSLSFLHADFLTLFHALYNSSFIAFTSTKAKESDAMGRRQESSYNILLADDNILIDIDILHMLKYILMFIVCHNILSFQRCMNVQIGIHVQ